MVRKQSMLNGKSAFMRTAEATIAIAMTFVFLTLFIPQYNTAKAGLSNKGALDEVYRDFDFRNCVLSGNISCINASLATSLAGFDYAINISGSVNDRASGLPDKKVFSESAFIAGNSTIYEPRILRIYYWEKG